MSAEGQIAAGEAQRESTGRGPPSGSVSEQYSLAKILGIWAVAALPMGALAWVVAPLVAGWLDGPLALPRTLLVLLTIGMIWQFVVVLVLVHRERGSLRWLVLRDALWLRAPRSPTTGRVGGRLWLVLVPALLIFFAEGLIPVLNVIPSVPSHDLAVFAQSDAFAAFMSDNWVWFAVIAALFVFNTALGEELLFRGLLLPRMQGAFGRFDWVANGVLFAAYHLHEPWVIPSTLVGDTLALSYPSRRYRSALIGIIVHSSQSVFFLALLLFLVLKWPAQSPAASEQYRGTWGHLLRLLRFLRNTLVWRLPIEVGGRIGSKTPLHEARAAVATSSAPLNRIKMALRQAHTTDCYGERNLRVTEDPVDHLSPRARCTAASRRCAKSAISVRRGELSVPHDRPLLAHPDYPLEDRGGTLLGTVGWPYRSIITIPTLYRGMGMVMMSKKGVPGCGDI